MHYVNALVWIARLFIGVLLIIIAVTVYEHLFDDFLHDSHHSRLPAFILLWLFTAYLVLPRVHRWLSKVYLPNYFVGRVRTGDNLLGDPVNLAVSGSEKKLIEAMEKSGWAQADNLDFKSTLKMINSSIRNKSYKNAPVSSLFLFGNKQNLAFQQEVNNSPRKRHHARFWKTPKSWWLPGGHKADWLGAATFDKNVGLSLFTGQITHKIDEYVDRERDFVVASLVDSGKTQKVHVVEHFGSGYHDRNGGGDRIVTDGALPFVTLK